MTKDETLKLALEALKQIDEAMPFPVAKLAQKVIKEALAQPEHGWTPERIAGMARLKEAQDKKLAQPEQEPVAWAKFSAKGNIIDLLNEPDDGYTPLYTTPPQRTWVGLTDEEIDGMVEITDLSGAYYYDDLLALAQAIEAKLKEKNNE